MKFKTKSFLPLYLAAISFASLPILEARTWTSATDSSKTFEGELLSYDKEKGMVSISKTGGKLITFPQDKLSAEDIAWLAENGKKVELPKPKTRSSSSSNIRELPDVLPDPDGEDADMSKPVQVYILMGQSNMLGFGTTVGGANSVEGAVKMKGKYPYLVDDDGEWTTRKDVRNVAVMTKNGFNLRHNEWLSIDSRKIGPEVGIGHYVGHVTDAPVLLLKSCIGNRSLGWDLLPPGTKPYKAGSQMHPGYRGTKENLEGDGTKPTAEWYAGKQYDDDVENAKKILEDLNKYYPGAKKYEIAGFFFWQGAKDKDNGGHADAYGDNLVNFIKALRKDFDAPDAKFVVATLGEDKKDGNSGVLKGQLSVDGDTGDHPEFKGNVKTVYSHPLSMGSSANGHYGMNGETYMNIGEAMGKAMVDLLQN